MNFTSSLEMLSLSLGFKFSCRSRIKNTSLVDLFNGVKIEEPGDEAIETHSELAVHIYISFVSPGRNCINLTILQIFNEYNILSLF